MIQGTTRQCFSWTSKCVGPPCSFRKKRCCTSPMSRQATVIFSRRGTTSLPHTRVYLHPNQRSRPHYTIAPVPLEYLKQLTQKLSPRRSATPPTSLNFRTKLPSGWLPPPASIVHCGSHPAQLAQQSGFLWPATTNRAVLVIRSEAIASGIRCACCLGVV